MVHQSKDGRNAVVAFFYKLGKPDYFLLTVLQPQPSYLPNRFNQIINYYNFYFLEENKRLIQYLILTIVGKILEEDN